MPYKFPAESKTTPEKGTNGAEPVLLNEKSVVRFHGPLLVGVSLKTKPTVVRSPNVGYAIEIAGGVQR